MLSPGSILLETARPDDENRLTLFFSNPRRVIEAYHPDEVAAALDAVDEQVVNGAYAAGYLDYEAGFAFEQIDELEAADEPIAWFGIYDHPVDPPQNLLKPPEREIRTEPTFSLSRRPYERQIRAVKERLVEGDAYQINLTGTFEFPFTGSGADLYRQLRNRQPVPYNALIVTAERVVISCSPELFFRRDGNRIWTRPMKGTVNRGRNETEDAVLSAWLKSDPKTRAENLMIVDLLRNDLSRIAEFGSVRVDKMFNPELYDTVIQMTTEVSASLRPGTKYADIFRAIFPSGSVTGAPKVRAMQIIRELERRRRGVYTGAIGYIDPAGRAVFSVAIRTVSLNEKRGQMGSGGGIVWDSSADSEYRECLLKGAFLTGRGAEPDLIETMVWDNGYRRLDRHLARIESSAHELGRPFDRMELQMMLDAEALRFHKSPMKVRVLLSPDGDVTMQAVPMSGASVMSGTVRLSQVQTDPEDEWLRHKSTRREVYEAEYALAVAEGHVEVIFVNERDEVTEGARTNVFVRKDGRLLTPPIECGVLPGTRRAEILATDPTASEAILKPADLDAADEILVCNATTPLTPVRLTSDNQPRRSSAVPTRPTLDT